MCRKHTAYDTFIRIFYDLLHNCGGTGSQALATLFLISKVMDGISDPVMGFILDRFPVTKMGKFRPMLILGTIICVINYILLWFGAVWSPVGKYVIVYVTFSSLFSPNSTRSLTLSAPEMERTSVRAIDPKINT